MNDRGSHSSTTVAIIGAGPSGLSLSRQLVRRNIDHLIIEKHDIANTWQLVPPSLGLLNPWWVCSMATGEMLRHHPLRYVDAAAFRAHLQRLARCASQHLRLGVAVTRVRPSKNGFRVELANGREVRAQIVVCATGYFDSPAPPQPRFDTDGSVPVIHAGQIRDYRDLARLGGSSGRVLIVGKRITAGQLLVVADQMGMRPSLSARQPIAFSPSGFWRRVRELAYYHYEPLRLHLQPNLKGNSFPPMQGGPAEHLIRSGSVSVFPPPLRVECGSVEFNDHSRAQFDLVVLATGYRPTLSYLPVAIPQDSVSGLPATREFEVEGMPGLFLLGFDNLRSFRSRYLRGIRADARVLARRIAAALGP